MDKLQGMRAFAAVVDEGSFVAAAEKLGMSPQLVSKYLSQLESALSVRLLNRTTRRVHLTEAGERYALRVHRILEDIEDCEAQLGDFQAQATGTLRLSAPVSFSTLHLAPLLCAFQQAHPGVAVDVQLNDRKVDIVEEGFDVALRIGRLRDSSLIARHVAPVRLVLCASPEYLQRHGTPRTLADLAGHRYLHYSLMDKPADSALLKALRPSREGGMSTNNGDILVQAMIAGAGIGLQPTFLCGSALAEGRLQQILPDTEPEPLGLYAVYANRQFLPAKVRHFIDFIDGYYGSPPYWDVF